MDWDKLRIFHIVAEAGSFTRAGETLCMSQSSVSRQISSLEESLDLSLFHRHARGLALTEQGEMLHNVSKDIFSKLSMIEGKLLDDRNLPEGPLKITVAEFIGSSWLAPKLAALRNKYPQLQLTVLLDDRIYNLGMREADVAIRLHKSEQPDLIQKHLSVIHFRLCASKSYLNNYSIPSNLRELRDHVLIGYPENVPAPFFDHNWLFRIADISPENNYNAIMINSMYGIHQLVKQGAGIAALPEFLIEEDDHLVALPVNVECPNVDMYFVYPEERRDSRRISVFRDFLLDNIGKTNF